MAGPISIAFVLELFGDLPFWIYAPLAILCFSMILLVIGFALVRFRRYLKQAWPLEDKRYK